MPRLHRNFNEFSKDSGLHFASKQDKLYNIYVKNPFLSSIANPIFQLFHISFSSRRYCQKTQSPDSFKYFPKKLLPYGHFRYRRWQEPRCKNFILRPPRRCSNLQCGPERWQNSGLATAGQLRKKPTAQYSQELVARKSYHPFYFSISSLKTI